MIGEVLDHKGEYPIILVLGFVLTTAQLTHNLLFYNLLLKTFLVILQKHEHNSPQMAGEI